MNRKQKDAFNQLWKVEALKQIKEFDDGWDGGKVTRKIGNDQDRTLKLIEYGFLEGINYAKSQQNVNDEGVAP